MIKVCFGFIIHACTVCVWQVLRDIMKLGPEVLLNISELYTMCVDSGLIPVSALHTLVKVVSMCYVSSLSTQRYCL